MSGGFFFEYVVEAMLNLEQQDRNNNTAAESKSPKADSVKKPKKK